MPKDDPSAYSPQDVAQELLALDSAEAIVTRLDELGWELAPSGQAAEEGIGDEGPFDEVMGGEGDASDFEGAEEEMEEDAGGSDVPMPVGPKPPYLTVLRMSAVDKAFDKHGKKGKKKSKKGMDEDGLYAS
jgi:hypothetical protein